MFATDQAYLYVVPYRLPIKPALLDRFYTGPELERLCGRRLLFWRAALPQGPLPHRVPDRRLALYRLGDVIEWLEDDEQRRTKAPAGR